MMRGARGAVMTLDQAIALSLVDDLPRVGLTDRLRASDPELLDLAALIAPDARDALQRAPFINERQDRMDCGDQIRRQNCQK